MWIRALRNVSFIALLAMSAGCGLFGNSYDDCCNPCASPCYYTPPQNNCAPNYTPTYTPINNNQPAARLTP